nr:hypothetical protein [Tanacetum cinerariifolium]
HRRKPPIAAANHHQKPLTAMVVRYGGDGAGRLVGVVRIKRRWAGLVVVVGEIGGLRWRWLGLVVVAAIGSSGG